MQRIYLFKVVFIFLMLTAFGSTGVLAQCQIIKSDPSCSDSNDGSIVVFLNDGTLKEKKYDLYKNGTLDKTASSEKPYTFKNLGGGTYRIEMFVKDGTGWKFGCKDSVKLIAPNALQLSSSTIDVKCHGDATGAIDLVVNGGIEPYTINWSNGDTLEDIDSLTAGRYSVLVLDAKSCAATLSDSISEPIKGITTAFSTIGNKCYGASKGSINMAVTGGTQPYTYKWSNGATDEDISKLPADTYYVEITDKSKCVKIDSVVVEQPKEVYKVEIEATNISCNGKSDGSARAVVSGGKPPYKYLWGNEATTDYISGLPEASYKVIITDSIGCTTSSVITIKNPSVITTFLVLKETDCSKTTGNIDLTVKGGTPPYTFDWSNGADTEDLEDADPGLYTILVTDSMGCSEDDTLDFPFSPIDCIVIPSAFTPNGDGVNDVWNIKNINLFKGIVNVYKINGEKVYDSNGNSYIPWDGRHNGKDVPPGTYYYTINLGSKGAETGAVTIVR